MSIFHQATNVFPSGLTVTNGITTDSLIVNGVAITSSGGGGGGGSVPLDSTIPTTFQLASAIATGGGLATYYTDDATKAASTKVTKTIMSEVDSINGEVQTLQDNDTLQTGQITELTSVVNTLTGLTLGSVAGSAFATAVSTFTGGGSTNNALKKADLLDQTTISSINSTSTTTTYDAKTISAIASAVNTLQGQTIPNLASSTNFGTNGQSAETFGNASQQTTVNGQVNIPYLNLQDTPRTFSIVSTLYPNIVVLPTVYSGIQAGMTVQFSGSVGPIGLSSGTNYTVSTVLGGANVVLTSISTLTNIASVSSVTMAFTISNPLTTATNFGTKATSTVTVGVSGQTTNIVGTVQINGTAYSAGSSVSAATTSSAGTVTLASAIDNAGNASYVPTSSQIVSYVASNAPNASTSIAGKVQLASAIDNTGNNNNVPTSGQIVSYVASATTTTSGNNFDIIFVNGQSNSVGMASDSRDPVLDASIASLPIYQLATGINGTANTIISAYEHIEVQHSQTYQGVNYSNSNGFVLTFAKLYALNYLQPGRKILIIHNGVGGTGMAGTASTPNPSVVNAMPTSNGAVLSGNVINMNWTPQSLASTTSPYTYTYNLTPSGTKTATVGDGVNSFNLYSVALQRLQSVLGATVSVDTTDGGITVTNNNKVVAMLWHQGETDAFELNVSIASYKVGLEALIDGFRAVAGSAVPFIVGNFTNYTCTTYSNTAPYVTYFKTFGTPTPPKYYTGFADSQLPSVALDNGSIHFGCKGYRTMGQRYFKAYQNALSNIPSPATLTGTLSVSTPTISNYNSSTNTYAVTLSGYTAAYGVTYLVYYGTTLPPAQASITPTTPTSTSLTINVPAPNGAAINYYFKLIVYNPQNSTPYPSLTTAATITVPASPLPTLGTMTASSAILSSVNLTISSASYYAANTDVVTFSSATNGGGTVYGNCTIAQFLVGYNLAGTWSSSSNTVYATLTNSVNSQKSSSASVTFAATTALAFTTAPSVTSSSVTNSSLTITWVLNSGTTPSGTAYTISTNPSSGVTIGTPTLSGGITSVNITTMTAGTSYTISISAACTGYTSTSTVTLTQFVGVAPTANLDIQLSFGSATLPSYTDNSLTQAITYKFNNSGGQQSAFNPNDTSNFAMYNDATRGYVLAANAQNLAQASNLYLGNYALLGTAVGTNNYHMPLNHTVMLWFYVASMPTGNAPHLLSCGSQIGMTHYIYFPGTTSQLTFFTNGATYTANPPSGYGGTWVGTWTHIARTYNGSTMLVYVNGALVNGSGNNGNGTADTSNDVNIAGFIDGGNYSTGNNNCLNGYLDNIRIYSTVLSGAQISNIYTYESANPKA
jgi:hypothetical protein